MSWRCSIRKTNKKGDASSQRHRLGKSTSQTVTTMRVPCERNTRATVPECGHVSRPGTLGTPVKLSLGEDVHDPPFTAVGKLRSLHLFPINSAELLPEILATLDLYKPNRSGWSAVAGTFPARIDSKEITSAANVPSAGYQPAQVREPFGYVALSSISLSCCIQRTSRTTITTISRMTRRVVIISSVPCRPGSWHGPRLHHLRL